MDVASITRKLDRIRDRVPTRWAYIWHRGSGKELVELPEDDPDGDYLVSQQCSEIPVEIGVTPTPEEIAKWREEYLSDLKYNTSYQSQRYLIEKIEAM